MSRGLGTAQPLMLKALASLEAEHGSGNGLFFVWAIVDRAYELSPEMQARHQAMTEASAARSAEIQARAAAGDERAALFLGLTRSLTRTRRAPRARRATPFRLTESGFNPSRVLASLERRGLVTRRAIKGGGSAGLTDAGRQEASAPSVGTSCAPFSEAVDV
ncbi:hypothetical protein MKK65_03720 [Methylobacterium sp. J-001]|uniref:hypothetical protein n=1 Tax=Methylobacterium sp. J-001 TaxID=2836609 RepID=UPI001FB8E699|nr:hypothetical protein [Methylobacterium sp. J-001]MCJ2115708.1 hypothetical protein [Methylobacterium sp. J-001]